MERPAFQAVRLGILSSEKMLSLSSGEVSSPETFDAKTQRPVKGGLLCEHIFGPLRKNECPCGGNRGGKRGAAACARCGAPLVDPRERRRRFGHIALAAPVVHVWYYKGGQSIIARLLGLPSRKVASLVLYELYIVIEPGESGLRVHQFLAPKEYEKLHAGTSGLRAETGAEAVRTLLRRLDLPSLARDLRERAAFSRRALARLEVVEKCIRSGVRPEWLVMDVLLVLPPDLRPTLFLDDGAVAESDLNALYARVIRKNLNIGKMSRFGAPEMLLVLEKRQLQTSVDCLFSNGRTAAVVSRFQSRPLRSLSDLLGSKQGIFRKHLLAKRVDYSARAPIVVGPELRLHQVGLPRLMALELYKPFLFAYLIRRGFAPTLRQARRLVEQRRPEVWDALDEAVAEHPVIVNRAPTLHMLSMQAFDPVLVGGGAIRLHPLVCAGFNADFDGDTVAVHLPLSFEAQTEARVLMLSVNNLFHPATGAPAVLPSQDIVLGLYVLTTAKEGGKGEGMIFADQEEAELACENGVVEEQARVKVRVDGSLEDTTAGRALLFAVLPSGIPFSCINKALRKRDIGALVEKCYAVQGAARTVRLLDDLKTLGYRTATRSGISLCLDDLHVPSDKAEIVAEAQREAEEVMSHYALGRISGNERYNKVVDIWTKATERVADAVMKELRERGVTEDAAFAGCGFESMRGFNSLFIMADSGARGAKNQIRQASGMRGLMAKPSGAIVELPVTASLREGLSGFQYFLSAHGARTGRVAAPLKTPLSGYFTRRLVYAVRDVSITTEDCGTVEGVCKEALRDGATVLISLEERIKGSYLADLVVHPVGGGILAPFNALVDDAVARAIACAGVERVRVRSPLTCKAERGVCARCYGTNLGRRLPPEIGDAVGIIAAHSIGEPGTQLTLRSFHGGGTASLKSASGTLGCLHGGVVRFNDLKCVRRSDAVLVVVNREGSISLLEEGGRRERERLPVLYGYELCVEEGEHVGAGRILARWDAYALPIVAHAGGTVACEDIRAGVTAREEADEYGILRWVVTGATDALKPKVLVRTGGTTDQYLLPPGARVLVREGEGISPGSVVASIPREASKSMDITGGLPRILELFEARTPQNAARISEIDGRVLFGTAGKNRLKITVEGEAASRTYAVPEGRTLTVYEGDFIKAGTPLADGPLDPHALLAAAGLPALRTYLVEEAQKVYRSHGVEIHDKHFEVIVRQMTGFVRIADPGGSDFLPGQIVGKRLFEQCCAKRWRGGQGGPSAEQMLVGITKVPFSSQSFLAAASFQDTTKVLAGAALERRTDMLESNAARIMTGKRIHGGTGLYAPEGREPEKSRPP
ncbi:MAG: DNA-directed RNA polymerase subunit beta' [Thermodesulfovibrionales bacterium]